MAWTQSDFNQSVDAGFLADGIVIPSYDKALKWALVPQLIWRQFIDVEPVAPTNNSNVVNLKRHVYLTVSAADLNPIDEVAAPDVTKAPQTINVPVTINEYGKTMGRTTFLGDVAYIPVDPALLKTITRHMGEVLDLKARAVFLTGTNRLTSNAGAPDATAVAVNTLTDADVLTGSLVRHAVKALRKRDVVPRRGELYAAVISHETSLDLQEDTGTTPKWHEPHIAGTDTAEVYNGEIGIFGGAFFIESNRAFADTDGATSAAVHRSVFFGEEVVAEAAQRAPHVGASPVTDPMNRHRGIYWYGSLGWALYRDEAVQRVEHGVTSGVV